MNHHLKTFLSVIVTLSAVTLFPQIRASAQAPALNPDVPYSLDAKDSEIESKYVLYHFAHVVTKNGTTLDADELKASFEGNKLQDANADGHVKTTLDDVVNKRKFLVTADNAVYDPSAGTIVLTGNVKIVVTSSYTDGPLVQTGTSATIYLGAGPDYPKIDMQQVHTELTVKQ